MDDNSFVKIEDKSMPLDIFGDLEEQKHNNGGFINIIFLSSVLTTAVMWIMLLFFRK